MKKRFFLVLIMSTMTFCVFGQWNKVVEDLMDKDDITAIYISNNMLNNLANNVFNELEDDLVDFDLNTKAIMKSAQAFYLFSADTPKGISTIKSNFSEIKSLNSSNMTAYIKGEGTKVKIYNDTELIKGLLILIDNANSSFVAIYIPGTFNNDVIFH